MDAGEPPATLAELVVARMTLAEKIGELILTTSGPYENVDAGVGRLCIPSLTLQDGPAGLAFGDTGVTELPAPLGIAASFDTALAQQYGRVIGAEARGQGIDVVQGPDLNIDRVPESGRDYESYGEDPFLTSEMGVADIEGIQSQGVMAQAKHLVAYNQETNRGALDARVSDRALQEIYLPPFEAAVTQGHVASIMCAYPQLNGTFQCEDPALTKILDEWGFSGFVRSDLGAVHDPSAALVAGTDLLKPATASELTDDVADGLLPVTTIDADVTQMLTQMFAYGLIGRTATGAPGTPVDTPSDTAVALVAAERSAVLLKNRSGLLPLDPARLRSVAVIGADASDAPVTSGFGSSRVVAPFTSTPLSALESRLGPGVTVRYADGGSSTRPLPSVPTADLVPQSGVGHGLTLTVARATSAGPSITTVDPVTDATIVSAPSATEPSPDQVHSNPPASRPRRHRVGDGDLLPDIDPGAAGATSIELPRGWSGVKVSWGGTMTPPRSGSYAFSLTGSGSASLTFDGIPAVTDTVTHDQGTWSGSIDLVAGHHYQMALDWTPVADPVDVASTLHLGMSFVGAAIARAVAAARASQVAVVFAADYSAETFDRPDLSLPGDENALIAAVAAVNPRTVVVLNTGGAVVMPWLDDVDSVLEDWYPGEEDGAAIAAVLTGYVDPSGHLPVTFPTSSAQSGISTQAQWPGVGLTSDYSEGLDVGYRHDHATGTQPLFPFGFGLSYTTFSFRHPTIARTPTGIAVSAVVTDTGSRAGTDVAQAYLTYPAAAGEPPAQLVAFAPVTLATGASQTVTLDVPSSAFQSDVDGAWTTVPGTYRIGVGDSSAHLPVGASVSVA